MSQHDFNIANQGFPATRSDINNALAALASTSSGTSEPSTTYANQFWYDTTNNLLKFRNEADSAWITLAYLDQATNEWEIRSSVIQAVDSAGISLKTDDGTARVVIQDDGDVAFDTDTLFVDAANDRVGVGTTSTDGKITAKTTGASNGTVASRSGLVLRTDDISTGYANSRIQWTYAGLGVSTKAYIEGGVYGNDYLAFSGGSSENMRINSSGNVAIGQTTHSGGNIIMDLHKSGSGVGCQIQFANDHSNAFYTGLAGNTAGEGIVWNQANAGILFGTNNTERMRILGNGMVAAGRTSSQNGNTFFSFEHEVYSENVTWSHNVSTSFQNTVGVFSSARTQNSGYKFLEGVSGWAASYDIEFYVRGDGQAYIDGSWNGGGADYAEYFEWSDGNTSNEDRVGYTVVLDGDKIRKATSSDDTSNIIGAVSGNPSVIGDTDLETWKYKYLRDDFGRYIRDTHNVVEWTETVVEEEAVAEVLDDYGNIATPAQPARTREVKHSYEDWNIPDNITVPDDATTSAQDENGNAYTHRRLNPNYDPDMAYVSREDRQEWATIGMMGKLRIRVGQPVGDRWIKMRDVSDTVEEWLVR